MRSPFLSLTNISAGAGDGAAETASIRFDSDQTDARNGSARVPIPAPTSQLIRTACALVPLLRKAKRESWVCDRRSYAADAAIAALCSSQRPQARRKWPKQQAERRCIRLAKSWHGAAPSPRRLPRLRTQQIHLHSAYNDGHP